MKYIKQLDSLRAIAVLLVIIGHWIPANYLLNRIQGAAIGVNTFFVLSGFLITWILLANREEAEIRQLGHSATIKSFYIRRTLRIFPVYYLLIFLLLVFHQSTNTTIKSSFPYFLTYTENVYFFKIKSWDGIVSHLWSLAVEEQFYLLWPALMLFVNKKYLLYVIYIFIGIGIASQLFLRGVPFAMYLTMSCFDAFGMGALLAWYMVYDPKSLGTFYKLTKPLALVALVFFVYCLIQTRWVVIPMIRTTTATMALFVITHIVYKKDGTGLKAGLILNNRVLIFLGRISYGIYLYHHIIPHYTAKLYGRKLSELLPYSIAGIVTFITDFVIVIIVSWISWKLIEKPFLNLKKYFSYSSDKKALQTSYIQ